MRWCQFINLVKFETRPSSLLNFGTANIKVRNLVSALSPKEAALLLVSTKNHGLLGSWHFLLKQVPKFSKLRDNYANENHKLVMRKNNYKVPVETNGTSLAHSIWWKILVWISGNFHPLTHRQFFFSLFDFALAFSGWMVRLADVQQFLHFWEISVPFPPISKFSEFNVEWKTLLVLQIDKCRYIKIQSKTIDLSTTLWGITVQSLWSL